MMYTPRLLELSKVRRIYLVILWDHDGRVIQVGTRNVGKLHEAIQAHLISSNIALGAQVYAPFSCA
jgi:hypothetical protein